MALSTSFRLCVAGCTGVATTVAFSTVAFSTVARVEGVVGSRVGVTAAAFSETAAEVEAGAGGTGGTTGILVLCGTTTAGVVAAVEPERAPEAASSAWYLARKASA